MRVKKIFLFLNHFLVWVTTLNNIIFSIFTWCSENFILNSRYNSAVCICHVFFIKSSADGLPSWFNFLAIGVVKDIQASLW